MDDKVNEQAPVAAAQEGMALTARTRFLLAAVVLGLLMTGPFGLTAALLFADAREAERAALAELLLPRLPLGALMTMLGFILGVVALRSLFRQYVSGLSAMAENLRLMRAANRSFRVVEAGPPEVQAVAREANELAKQRDELMIDVDAQIARARSDVEAERNRLAALISELSLAVIVCNLDGRVLLYNNRARLQFKALAQGTAGGAALIGLGRSIFSVLDRSQISHALENVQHRLRKGSSEPVAQFVTATKSGQLLRAQMAPVLARSGGDAVVSGYVLTIENITRSFERDAERDQAIASLADESRPALSNLRSALRVLTADQALAGEQRRQLELAEQIAAGLGGVLEQAFGRFAASQKSRWPLEDVLAVDVIAAASRRIEGRLGLPTKHEDIDESLWMRAESFSLLQAMVFLASRLQDHYEIRELRLRALAEGNAAFVDLIWSGVLVSTEALHTWELEPMSVGEETTSLTLRDMLERHGGEIRYQRDKAAHRAFFRLVLPVASAPTEVAATACGAVTEDSRPEYYDFNLFEHGFGDIDLERKLSELAYTVFDTETTGLQPSQGDEIIQFGAVRVVNGRLLRQETFEQLVDPRMPLKPEGIPIHGITDAMVRGQPVIDTVLPAFYAFCADTVLVGHNVAFDMRFLQLKEDSTGIRFRQPVLDTLLLSAVVQPNQESHKLEAIAERLGVNVIGRHTALGDALVAGEIFLKLVALLEEQGIHTLGEALAAAEKTYFARIRY
jgi:DNA polymerase III subunit epsilon